MKYIAFAIAQVSGGGKAFRYGGEEFTILFPGKKLDEAAAHLERLRETIAKRGFTLRGKDRPKKKPQQGNTGKGSGGKVNITVSIGQKAINTRGWPRCSMRLTRPFTERKKGPEPCQSAARSLGRTAGPDAAFRGAGAGWRRPRRGQRARDGRTVTGPPEYGRQVPPPLLPRPGLGTPRGRESGQSSGPGGKPG